MTGRKTLVEMLAHMDGGSIYYGWSNPQGDGCFFILELEGKWVYTRAGVLMTTR